eukprot:TRINITY_DN59517_c0_g1_i1.p1 TRINITY_DN59517_c0_g1~~TRINITY_DN59517_c0_g1_i1.p1  ORF type:complete len:323 (+),score=50.76 TRINITY_DN59517_c0_g1_i1:64-969(+)
MASAGYYAQFAFHDGSLPPPTEDEKQLERLVLETMFHWQYLVRDTLPYEMSLQDWIEKRMPGKVEFVIDGSGRVTLQSTQHPLKQRLVEPAGCPPKKKHRSTNGSDGLTASARSLQEPAQVLPCPMPRQDQQQNSVASQQARATQIDDVECSEEVPLETEVQGLSVESRTPRLPRLLLRHLCEELLGPVSEGDVIYTVTEVSGGFEANLEIPAAARLIKDPPIWYGDVRCSRTQATDSAALEALQDFRALASAENVDVEATTEEVALRQREKRKQRKKTQAQNHKLKRAEEKRLAEADTST